MQYITSVERLGIEKGKEIGMNLGIEQGKRALLRHQLLRRFDKLPAQYEALLTQASEKQLLAWSDRLFDAKTLADCFKIN